MAAVNEGIFQRVTAWPGGLGLWWVDDSTLEVVRVSLLGPAQDGETRFTLAADPADSARQREAEISGGNVIQWFELSNGNPTVTRHHPTAITYTHPVGVPFSSASGVLEQNPSGGRLTCAFYKPTDGKIYLVEWNTSTGAVTGQGEVENTYTAQSRLIVCLGLVRSAGTLRMLWTDWKERFPDVVALNIQVIEAGATPGTITELESESGTFFSVPWFSSSMCNGRVSTGDRLNMLLNGTYWTKEFRAYRVPGMTLASDTPPAALPSITGGITQMRSVGEGLAVAPSTQVIQGVRYLVQEPTDNYTLLRAQRGTSTMREWTYDPGAKPIMVVSGYS